MLCCLLALCCACAPAGVAQLPSPADADGGLTVTFFRCGKADSALLRTDEHAVLIDAGTQDAGEYVLSRLREMGVERLDALIVTHPHKDHVGGADVILEGLPVERAYVGPLQVDSKQSRQFDEALEAAGLTPQTLQAGDALSFGDLSLLVLGPQRLARREQLLQQVLLRVRREEEARLSVLRAQHEREVVFVLIVRALRAEVLKVPHHGGAEDNSALFFQAVLPEVAVIPCERGTKDDLPDEAVLRALRSTGAAVYVTDDGDVTVRTDGTTLTASQ